jgi:hypothetical protein
MLLNSLFSTKMSLCNKEDPSPRKQVRQHPYLFSRPKENGLFYGDAVFSAVLREIGNAKEVQVRRIIPFIGKRRGNRGPSTEKYLEACGNMRKVGKADNNFSAHSQRVNEHGLNFFTCCRLWFNST